MFEPIKARIFRQNTAGTPREYRRKAVGKPTEEFCQSAREKRGVYNLSYCKIAIYYV